MGACASKFKVLKDGADAPLPAPAEEVATKDLNLVEEIIKKNEAPAVAADDEAKPQSLGHLLKENEGEKGSAEKTAKASEGVKLEDATEKENVKSPEPVADAPTKDETEKAPATDGLKSKTSEEKKAEDVKPASQNVEVEASQKKTEESDESKPDEKPSTDEKSETLETQKIEEQELVLAEEKKETEEKPADITKLETLETKKPEERKTGSDAEKKKTEEKPAEITKIETSEKPEDKQVLEPPTTQKFVENKPEEQKPVSDAEKPKAGEEIEK